MLTHVSCEIYTWGLRVVGGPDGESHARNVLFHSRVISDVRKSEDRRGQGIGGNWRERPLGQDATTRPFYSTASGLDMAGMV